MTRTAESFQALLAAVGHMSLTEFAEAFDENQKEETEEDGPDHN